VGPTMARYWTLVNSERECARDASGIAGMPKILGRSGLVALTVSGAVSFAAVVAIARIEPEGDVPLGAAARPWKRAPAPEVRPLDDNARCTPKAMHQTTGALHYLTNT